MSFFNEGDIVWSPHPRFSGVMWFPLGQTLAMEWALVEMQDDALVPEHVHDCQDDILYILRGQATIWVEGSGDLLLSEGSHLRIPKGTRHRPHGFSNGFRILNIWAMTS